MVSSGIEGIVTLCTILGLLCLCQILVCGILSFTVSEVLAFTGSEFPTGVTLVAGLIALPATTRIRMSKVLPNMDRIFGYTLCYLQLVVIISLVTNVIASLLALMGIFRTQYLTKHLLQLLKQYHVKRNAKEMIDNVQFGLQCCGSHNYKDWFKFEWGAYKIDFDFGSSDRGISDLLSDEEEMVNERSVKQRFKGFKNDAVPFSCCARWTNSSCLHTNIHVMGTKTINKEGCAPKLKESVDMLLWIEFAINTVCASLEIGILVLLKIVRNVDCDVFSSTGLCKGHNMDNFTNDSVAEAVVESVAEIAPSAHSEVTINKT